MPKNVLTVTSLKQHCQKESNGYFVNFNNCIKNLSSLSYINDPKIQKFKIHSKKLINVLISNLKKFPKELLRDVCCLS